MNKKKKQTMPTQNTFKYSAIASAIVSMAASTAAYAEQEAKDDTAEDDVEVILVEGTRKDWLSAQNLKKGAANVLDALSAEDVGVLPDRSVLEAIARVPGVTMSRIVDGNDSEHFGTEGTGVNVRGLTFVRSEFNGRDSFSASGGGGLNFSDVSPELLGSVEVYKSPMASQVEGGIGGTVNLITKKPFDSDGQLIGFSVDATYADLREETTPSFSGLYSNVIDTDDNGRFGFLFSYSDNELKTMSDSMLAGRLQSQVIDGKDVWIPRGARINRKQDDRYRQGGALSLQWESPDNTVRLTGEYIRSDAKLSWAERAIEVDAESATPFGPVAGTQFEFDENGVFEQGVLTTDEGWRGNDAERQPPGIYGKQFSMVTRNRTSESLVEDFSFKLELTPTDSLAVKFDIQHIKAEAEVLDMTVYGATRAVADLDYSDGGMPSIALYTPEYNGEADYDLDAENDFFTSRHNTFLSSAMDHISDNDAEETAVKFDTSYQFDEGFFTAMEFGARYAKREQINRQSKYNWGYLSEAWTGDGSIWLDQPQADGIPMEIETFEDFGRGADFQVAGGAGILFPGRQLVDDYEFAKSVLPNVSAGDGAWTALADRPGTTGNFVPDEINDIEQVNTAAYFQANFASELSDYYITGNFGIRYVNLETKAAGFLRFPDSVADPNDPDDIYGKLPADQQAFGNAAFEPISSETEFSTYLPSFNMKVELSEQLITRLGLSKSIAYPNLGMLRNHTSISGADMIKEYDETEVEPTVTYAEYERYTANSGNPDLKPLESKNIDLTLEWYFADVGSLTTSLFHKDLEGYFINGNRFEQYENNGVTKVVETQGAVNSGEGKIKGFEIAYQQFYDFLPGVGLQINYTYIDESGAPNSGLKPDFPLGEGNGNYEIGFDNLPLEGVSKDNFNIVAMYEKNKWQARLAYNWRSDYLLTSSDVRTLRPTFNEAAGYLDASVFYQISDNITFGVQASNLTDTVNKTYVWVDETGIRAPKGSFVQDRRISAIFRATF